MSTFYENTITAITSYTPLLKDFAIIIAEYCKEIEFDIGEAKENSHYPGDVCGYGFFAPCDFRIIALKVDDSYLKDPQSVQVVRFIINDQKKDIGWCNTSQKWEPLFHSAESNEDKIYCDIKINKGDGIGIIGYRGEHCSPRGEFGPYKTRIYDDELEIFRVTTAPNRVDIPHTKEKRCQIGRGGRNGSFGRVQMWYI